MQHSIACGNLKVTVAFNFNGAGIIQTALSDMRHITQSSANFCIRKVSGVLLVIGADYISFPIARETQRQRAQEIDRLCDFPVV